jgi:hypothetical protein
MQKPSFEIRGRRRGGRREIIHPKDILPPQVDYPEVDTGWIRGIILPKWIIRIIWGGGLVGLIQQRE